MIFFIILIIFVPLKLLGIDILIPINTKTGVSYLSTFGSINFVCLLICLALLVVKLLDFIGF